MSSQQRTFPAILWEHVLQVSTRDTNQTAADFEFPQKLTESFWQTLKLPGLIYLHQTDIAGIGAQKSQEYYRSNGSATISRITAFVYQVHKQRSSFLFKVILNQWKRRGSENMNWPELENVYGPCDCTWSFWLSSRVKPEKPAPG